MPENQLVATNKDTTTYDVQQRTFIKKPEPKVCLTCGQLMQPDVTPLRHQMSYYISGVAGAKPVVVAHTDDVIKVGEVTMYRVTDDKGGVMTSKFVLTTPAPTPVKQTTPTK